MLKKLISYKQKIQVNYITGKLGKQLKKKIYIQNSLLLVTSMFLYKTTDIQETLILYWFPNSTFRFAYQKKKKRNFTYKFIKSDKLRTMGGPLFQARGW